MVHNGIEYGDMQLISEAYDILKSVGGLTNEELAAVFDEWNKTELESFLVEITASIFKKKDEMGDGFLVDKVLDKTGMKVSKKLGICFAKAIFRLKGSNLRPRGYGPRTLPLRQAERLILIAVPAMKRANECQIRFSLRTPSTFSGQKIHPPGDFLKIGLFRVFSHILTQVHHLLAGNWQMDHPAGCRALYCCPHHGISPRRPFPLRPQRRTRRR